MDQSIDVLSPNVGDPDTASPRPLGEITTRHMVRSQHSSLAVSESNIPRIAAALKGITGHVSCCDARCLGSGYQTDPVGPHLFRASSHEVWPKQQDGQR